MKQQRYTNKRISERTESEFQQQYNHLALICCTAAGGRCPWTTEMFTPAFSKVVPSWITHVMPPPPSGRSQRSTWNFVPSFSSASKARQNSAYRNKHSNYRRMMTKSPHWFPSWFILPLCINHEYKDTELSFLDVCTHLLRLFLKSEIIPFILGKDAQHEGIHERKLCMQTTSKRGTPINFSTVNTSNIWYQELVWFQKLTCILIIRSSIFVFMSCGFSDNFLISVMGLAIKFEVSITTLAISAWYLLAV